MEYSVCLLAAGKGSRTQLDYNKVFYELSDGKTVLDHSLSLFLMDEDCVQVIIACAEYEKEKMERLYKNIDKVEIVIGGHTRQESVSIALKHVFASYVFIHDAARPYLKQEYVDSLKECLKKEKACLLMVPSVDTIKIVENGYVKETIERSRVYHAQTPQCFDTELIRKCHACAEKENWIGTDDAQLVERFSDIPIKVVLSDCSNVKITLPTDLK